jgi:hypothetical protein
VVGRTLAWLSKLYVSCEVCKLPPAWFRLSYLTINCACVAISSFRSSFARDPALK